MQIFENNSFNTFLFNNNSHVKNYVVIPVGNTHVSIYNAYDTKLQLLPSTHYSQVSIDGQTYTTQAELMSVLSPLLFYKGSGGTEGGGSITNQNNVGKITEYPLLNGTGAITTSEVANFLNNYVIPFYVTETNTPVLFSFNRQENGITKKYIFIFLKGKGSWGGQSGANPVYSSYFRLLSVLTLTGEDIENGDNNQIYDLGIIPDGDFVSVANASDDEFDFSNSSQSYYFTYTQNDVLYFNLFIGTNGVYAGESGNTFDENDFVGITNSNVQPVPDLQQVTEIDNTTTHPIVTYGGGYKVSRHNTGEDYTDANGRVIRVNYPTNELTEESVIYDIPAKTLNDVFVMHSDINGMTITANQAASEIYLNNAEGDIIATLNVAFLNNEGTTFFYNETTEKLELKNDSGEVLSEVPVSAFVSNLIQSVNFNGVTPYVLEFKDASGNVVDSVTFTISNIQGLQSALDGKISTSHPTNGITSANISNWNTAFSWGNHDGKYLPLGGSIPNSVDLNNYITNGVYIQILNSQAENGVNYPVPLSGSLEVYSIGSGAGLRIFQKYHVYGANNDLYIRSNTGGNWYPWVKVLDSVDVTSENISNWNTAFGWGDYRQFGLGATAIISNDWNSINQTGFYYNNSASATGTPLDVANISLQHIEQAVSAIQIAFRSGGDGIWFRRRVTTAWSAWANIWTSQEFTQSSIDNWNASWNNQKIDSIYANSGDGTDANVVFSGTGGHIFSYGSTAWLANRAWNSYGGLITFKKNTGTSAHGLQFQYDVGHLNPSGGRLAFRTGGDTIKPWKTIWNDGDFTSTQVSNWDTAYSWGDFRTFGLGESILPVTDLTSSNVNVNRFFRFLSSANGSGGFAGGAVSIRYDNAPSTSFIGANGSYAFVGYKNGENVTPQFYKLWDTRNFSQTEVNNWNTAYSWGNHSGKYVGFTGNTGYATLFTGDINALPYGNMVHAISGSATNQPPNIGTPRSLFTFGARNNNDPLLTSDLVIGTSGLSFRNRTNDIWRKVWTDSDFTSSDIFNWNTAYGWGNHAGLYMPAGVFSGSTSDYISGDGTVYNFRNSVKSTPLTDFSPEVNSVGEGDSIQLAIEKLSGTQGSKANLASPNFTGTPTAPTAPTGTSTTQIATTAFVQNTAQEITDNVARPYKSYTVIITQTGTNPPLVQNTLENTLGVTPTWSYINTGVYRLTATDVFPQDKTFVTHQLGLIDLTDDVYAIGAYVDAGSNHITLQTRKYTNGASAGLVDGILNRSFLEIRVYN